LKIADFSIISSFNAVDDRSIRQWPLRNSGKS